MTDLEQKKVQRREEMTQILIDSDKKKIKREIGQAFLDLLQYTTYKKILKKDVEIRSAWEKK